jgi:hypothetical protein
MENLRYDPSTVLTLATDRQRSVRAKVRRRPRHPWSPAPAPRIDYGVTAMPRIPEPRPAETPAYADAHAPLAS